MNTNREETLFAAALERPFQERAAFLDGACLGDAALRSRVESLLASHEATLNPLATVVEPAGSTLKVDLTEIPDEAVGQTLGRYKLLERVGEGGCGVVYVAEQTEPVRRRVALKVIKLGMDTKQVVARFEAERQALAMMDHPNIAKVLDAGTTELGRPYFVMELVRGIRITDYCDQANLSTKERLDLFIKVCQAIQHAHQKGIIHRDIKPSNILVTLHDGVPVPKVIDFGIAKATEGRLTDNTVYTQLHQFIGTPAYMSPEQAEMSGLDIDTRSDIYALGVLLYELLTGKTPFDAKELVQSGIDAMRKTIREKEPQRPSTRLTQALVAAEGTKRASGEDHRSASSRRRLQELVALIRGDLDWIVMKCLEKDRTRRYETANGLAADLKRHLGNEPVVARPPSAGYRFQKALRRNRLTFIAGASIVGALLFGIVATSLESFRAMRAEKDALAAQANETVQRRKAEESERNALLAQASETKLRMQSQVTELIARQRAYASDVNLAQQALAANNLGRARRLLDRQLPQSGQSDLRGWEWRYLWGQTRSDEHQVFWTGTNSPSDLSYSGDGRLLGFCESGSGLVLMDLFSRKRVFTQTRAEHLAFAHRASVLAFDQPSPGTNASVVLWDTLNRRELRRLPLPNGQVGWLVVLPDDERLLTYSFQAVGFPGVLSCWNITSGELLWRNGLMAGQDLGRLNAISPDGRTAAVDASRGRFVVLDTETGRARVVVTATSENVLALVFSPDGKAVIQGSGYTDPVIRIWDANDGKLLGSLEGHRAYIHDLVFSPDGRRLFSASADQTIRAWNWPSRDLAGTLRGHRDEVWGCAIAPDGTTLASRCKDGEIYLWDVTAPPSQHLGYRTLPGLPRAIQFSSPARFTPDGQSILAAERDGGIALWNVGTMKEARRLWSGSTNRTPILISPDARTVGRLNADRSLHIWDVQLGLEITNLNFSVTTFPWQFADPGRLLISIHRTPNHDEIEVLNRDTGERSGSFSIKMENPLLGSTLTLSNVFVLRQGEVFQFHDLGKPGSASREIPITDMASFYCPVLSPDGRIAACAVNHGVQLWDMATLKPVELLTGFLLGVHSVEFSPEGRRLAAGSNGREAVKLWDTDTWQELLTLEGVGSLFPFLQFSSDGRSLMAISDSGLVHVWSAPTFEEIAVTAKGQNGADQP